MTDGAGTTSASAARRYPALVWLVAAGSLALLLPSGLTLPQSGPPTLAELAPVPGEGAGAQGDLTQIGETSSGGLGAGIGAGDGGPVTTLGAGGGDDGATAGDPGRLVRKPGTKRCVGKPARQTEDPLSPPCIAFFEGDNGGATAKGVTKDEVVVVGRFESGGTRNERTAPVECNGAPEPGDTFPDALCRAYIRYFNDRYQTYGRTVRLVRTIASSQDADVDARYQPFAFFGVGRPGIGWPRRGTMTFGHQGAERAVTLRAAPFGASFRADIEDQHAQTATFICQKLVGRAARWAGDPRLTSQQRKLGFLFVDQDGYKQRKEGLRTAIRSTCGIDVADETAEYLQPTGVARLQQAGVTSVILIVGNTAHATASNHATNLGWFPEWLVVGDPGLNGIDVNFHARTANPVQWRNAFGLTFDIRRPSLPEQPWYRAYKEACGPCPEPAAGESGILFAAASYEVLSLLFHGIQAAGPRLTAANVDKGLHAIPARPSDDPFRPASYFAPGNHSFMKDAMAIWWDPAGRPPGSAGSGCYRLPREGRRARAGEWPTGDDDIRADGPCQADTFQ